MRRGGDRLQQRGADAPDRVDGGLRRRVRDHGVDQDVAADRPQQQHQHADEDEAEADRAQRPAAPGGEVDGAGEAEQGDQGEDDRQLADEVGARLGGRELVGLEDHQAADVGRQVFGGAGADADLVAHFFDQMAEVQRHFAVFGGDGRAAAVEDFEQPFVRLAVGGRPERLDLRALQRPFGDLRRERAQAGRDRGGERLQPRRQLFFQLRLHRFVGGELFGEVVGEPFVDLLVGEDPAAGADPVVGVQRLAVGPDREGREQREDRADDEQHRDPARMATPRTIRLLCRAAHK